MRKFKAHTEPIFKGLSILKFNDKIKYCQSVFMNQYRNKKLPDSFLNIFTDLNATDDLQTRNNDYNFSNNPSQYKKLENFPLKCMIRTWNSLEIDLKATSDHTDFQILLKEKLLEKYDNETHCDGFCFSCDGH